MEACNHSAYGIGVAASQDGVLSGWVYLNQDKSHTPSENGVARGIGAVGA